MKKSISLLLIAVICLAVLPVNADNRYTAEMPILYQEGQSVFFGQYEQDNNLENGPEDIEWIVLGYNGSHTHVMLYSRYGLDAKAYNESGALVKWEDTTLYGWLNSDFKNAAFTAEEQDYIWKVSLLESMDVMFSLNSRQREITPTDYAIAQGATALPSFYGLYNVGWWWIRPSLIDSETMSYRVSLMGEAGAFDSPDVASACVRPLIYVDASRVLPDPSETRSQSNGTSGDVPGDEIQTRKCELCGEVAQCQYTTRLALSFWACPDCREWMLGE